MSFSSVFVVTNSRKFNWSYLRLENQRSKFVSSKMKTYLTPKNFEQNLHDNLGLFLLLELIYKALNCIDKTEK